MLSGLRNAIRHYTTTANKSVKSDSSPDLDRVLEEDARTRKQRLSKFNWYQEKIKTRNAAESKLRQSTGRHCLPESVKVVSVKMVHADTAVMQLQYNSNKATVAIRRHTAPDRTLYLQLRYFHLFSEIKPTFIKQVQSSAVWSGVVYRPTLDTSHFVSLLLAYLQPNHYKTL